MNPLSKRTRSSSSSKNSTKSSPSSSSSQDSHGDLASMFKRINLKSKKPKKDTVDDTLASLFKKKASFKDTKTRVKKPEVNSSLIITGPNSNKPTLRSVFKMNTSVSAPVRTRRTAVRSRAVKMEISPVKSSQSSSKSPVGMQVNSVKSNKSRKSSSKTGGDSLGNMFQGLANSSMHGLGSVADKVTSMGESVTSQIQGAMHMGGKSCGDHEGGKRRHRKRKPTKK